MNRLLCISLLLNICFVAAISAQTPASCFEIESILVDACGTPEWENEMVRFTVGPAPLNVNNMSVTWPNNVFRGMCRNATTASAVSALNATIQGCGYLIEPTAGILPAGAKVLFFTDVNVSTTANSFTNLNDTLYAIFQCSGNSAGHFVNYSSTPGSRTLTISFSSPASCSDQVTYDRALLINQNGGQGGSSSSLDGGRVDFDWTGNATYANAGCQAPFIPLTADAGQNQTSCSGSPVTLNGTVSGNYQSILWTGGTGTFSNPGNDTTSYTPATGESGLLTFTLNVVSACNDTIKSTVTVSVGSNPVSSISLSGNDTICAGSSVTLTASGGSTYLWNTGSSLPSIQVTTAGAYTVTASNNCGTSVSTQYIGVSPQPATSITASGPLTFCNGGSVTLTASGAETYQWSDGSTGNSITVTASNTYTVTGSTSLCGSSTASETVTVLTPPQVSINSSGPSTFCEGSSLVLTASGADTYSWSNGITANTITVTESGNYTVTGTNSCGTDEESVIVTVLSEPVASISGTLAICNGETTNLTASGSGSYLWSTGETSGTINVSSAASLYLVVTNACGDDTAYANVTTESISASITADTLTGYAPLTVQLQSTSVNASSNSWSFGDSANGTGTAISHTYSEPGTYFVELTSTSLNGCVDTASLKVVVLEPVSILEVPNVFTPNADNKNDRFLVKHRSVTEFHADIFNRWGVRIATVTDINAGWDGLTESGNEAPSGTYFCLIKAKGSDNAVYNLHTAFMLFR